jgi:hypothetical protein
MKKLRVSSRRVIIGGALFAAFLVMASIFAPGRSEAEQETFEVPSIAYSEEARRNMSLIGELEGTRYTVELYATPFGPLYSVYDRDGRQLADLFTADQVTARFPDLPINEAHADVSHETMGADVGGGNR